MPPKKAQKMSLNEFLGDNTLGSWADEMDALPTAPAARSDDDGFRPGERRRDDFLSSRPDRGPLVHREDLPLPTEPPFTSFVGNLAFDLTELDLEEFFAGIETKSIKIIKDRDERPKGFGYVEFATLDGLKAALDKSGTVLANRTVRISVAEPPKERAGFGSGGGFDDEKFAGDWRRSGPLPDLGSRDGPRRRPEGPGGREPPPPAVSDNVDQWRSSKPRAAAPPEPEGPSFKRRGSGFGASQGAADSEETWSIGSKFKPSGPPEGGAPGSRFGSLRGRGDMGPPRDTPSPADEGVWRRPGSVSRDSTSPNNSVPPTPQMGRRKLELLPRSGTSSTPSPLSSPNPANTQKPSPFGAAKPVDTLSKEAAVAERLEKEREQIKERTSHPMSRTSSKAASHRGEPRSHTPTTPSSPKADSPKPAAPPPTVRSSFSFASAAAGKKDGPASEQNGDVQEITKEVEKLEVS